MRFFVRAGSPLRSASAAALAVVLLAGCFGGRGPRPSGAPPPAIPGVPLPGPLPPRYAAADSEYFTGHPLMVPVEGVDPARLPDTFYEKRGSSRIHEAQDILAPRGTRIVAAIDGRIRRMSQNALGGITIYAVDSDEKYVFYYAHLDHYADAVTVGLEIHQGDLLGYVGTSGNAPPDTPHLHFQTMRLEKGRHDWWNGTPIDARPFMRIKGEWHDEGE